VNVRGTKLGYWSHNALIMLIPFQSLCFKTYWVGAYAKLH